MFRNVSMNQNQVTSRSHWKCTKHVTALKLYKNKLAILNAAINAASFYVSMSLRLS